jgi:hypothetical protein
VRSALGIPGDHRVVLLSVSGAGVLPENVLAGAAVAKTTFVEPGPATGCAVGRGDSRIEVAGSIYHPDLVAASDLVVGKLGYSTVAEVYHARTRFAFLRRPRFPESPVLEAFVRAHNPSVALPEDWLTNPATPGLIDELLTCPRPEGSRRNGADDVADLILDRIDRRD